MTWINPAQIAVPAQNSTDNNYLQDVVGNKTDDGSGNSIYSLLHIINEHDHSAPDVYPSLANGIDVTSGVGVWTQGSFAEIVPASTITSVFDIHYINVEVLSANNYYELALYSGALASEVLIGKARFVKNAVQAATQSQPFQTIRLPANTRISANLACDDAVPQTATISLSFHRY